MGFADGYLVGLSASKGTTLWPPKRLRTRTRFYDVDRSPYVDEQSVIAATFDGKLFSVDRTSGQTQWTVNVGSYGGFVVEKDRLYFAGLNGNAYGIDRTASGKILWTANFKRVLAFPLPRREIFL